MAATNVISNSAAADVVTKDLRDIKPPVEIPNAAAWFWAVVATLAIIVLGLVGRLAWLLWRERQLRMKASPAAPPQVRARQMLEEALASIGNPRLFGILVSDAIRQYLEARFRLRASERTTEEFLYELKESPLLTPDQKEGLGDFLRQCDLIKFSRYEPGEPGLRDLHRSALRLIEETEELPEPVKPAALDAKEQQRLKRGEVLALTGALMQIVLLAWTIFYGKAVINLLQLLAYAVTHLQYRELGEFMRFCWEMMRLFPGLAAISIIAWILGIAGWILLAVALVSARYRAEWISWFLVFFSLILLGLFPVGTAFAIFFLLFVHNHRSEFFARPANNPGPV